MKHAGNTNVGVSFIFFLFLVTIPCIIHSQTTQPDQGPPAFDNPFAEPGQSGIGIGPSDTVGTSSTPQSVANPFHPDQNTAGANKNAMRKPPWWYPIVIWQKSLNDKLSTAMKNLKENFSYKNVIFIFLISLVYSMLHTAGPGHGKVILGTYFLTSDIKRKKTDAAIAGIIVSITHIGMAFILSLFLYIFIHSLSMSSQRDMTEISRRVGGIFVILTGFALMAITLFRNKISFLSTEQGSERFKNYSLYVIAVLSGIVPCPLAWFALVFSISYDIYFFGIISILGMAIGAALTVGTTGFIVLLTKDRALSFFSENTLATIGLWLRFAGGVILVLVGIVMVL